MGTKNDPGEYDCHAKAHPDEPMFTLLGRDPLAAHLVLIWAALASGKPGFAKVYLQDAIDGVAATATQPEEKWLEALVCSDAMTAWRKSMTADAGRSAPSAAHAIPRSESTDTPNAVDATA